jgi:mycofactocin biosynthetic radical S-adenosylmethionine protein MftC
MGQNRAKLTALFKSYIFKNKPLYVHYGITHRCNLQCRMCKIYKEGNEAAEISLGRIETIFTVLKEWGVLYVSIGGGEPFLRKDLLPVIALLRNKGFMVRLLTNGTLADENLIKQFVPADLREISVSLDTLNSRLQDHIYNSEGVFDKVMNNMELFSRYIPGKNRLLLINTVVSRLNIAELPDLALFAKKKGYYISFIPIDNSDDSEFNFMEKDNKQIDEIYEYLIKMKKRPLSPILNSSMFLNYSRRYLTRRPVKWRCDAGGLYFSMNPAGGISICHKFEPEGSLPDERTREVIMSRAFENKRKSLINGCPGCMRPCWAEISFLMRNPVSLYEALKVRFNIKEKKH